MPEGNFWLALFLAGRRTWVRGAGAFFFYASMLARRAVHQIDDARRRCPPHWRDLFAGLFLLKQVDESVLISVLEVRWIEVARFVAHDVTCKIHHVLRQL